VSVPYWVPYTEGDPIPERTFFWVTLRSEVFGRSWVEVAERATRKDQVFFWTSDLGRCSSMVTHYAHLDWPAPAST
jgi:hypothetical protein